VEETELAVYEHGAEAADEVADELRDGIRDMVLCELEPETAWKLRWSAAGFPTVMEIDILAGDSLFPGLDKELQRALLADESTQTAVERGPGDGILPAIRVKRARGALATVQELAAVFDQCVGPASLEASTRRGYQAAWRTVLTWGIAHRVLGQLMPMSKDTLKALTQELLMVGCAAGTIKNVWCSISDRHRRFGYDAPLAAAGDFQRLYKAVAAIKGAPSKLLFPIGTHHLLRLLDLIGLTECQSRDVLVCATGMALCCRVIEVTDFQICDMLWKLDAEYDESYAGTLAVHIYRRKQDKARKGLYPRIGIASRAEWDIAQRLRRHADRYGLRVDAQCIKKQHPGARCRHCSPFFFTLGRGNQGEQERLPMSRQQVSNAVRKSLELIGVDTEHYSGKSMLLGGISAALTAKVQAPVLYLQSGHGSQNAAQNYMVPKDPSVWYENFAALDL
jgi:hypothetical protein